MYSRTIRQLISSQRFRDRLTSSCQIIPKIPNQQIPNYQLALRGLALCRCRLVMVYLTFSGRRPGPRSPIYYMLLYRTPCLGLDWCQELVWQAGAPVTLVLCLSIGMSTSAILRLTPDAVQITYTLTERPDALAITWCLDISDEN